MSLRPFGNKFKSVFYDDRIIDAKFITNKIHRPKKPIVSVY